MTTSPKHNLPTHVLTHSTVRDSTILCEQICSVSKERVGEYLCTLPDKDMQAVDCALLVSLGITQTCPADCKGAKPIDEETSKALEDMKVLSIELPDPEKIKLETERDLYKKFSEDLVEILKTGRV